MMNGGNILVLQKLLGHSTLTYDYALCTPVAGSFAGGENFEPIGAVDTLLTPGQMASQIRMGIFL